LWSDRGLQGGRRRIAAISPQRTPGRAHRLAGDGGHVSARGQSEFLRAAGASAHVQRIGVARRRGENLTAERLGLYQPALPVQVRRLGHQAFGFCSARACGAVPACESGWTGVAARTGVRCDDVLGFRNRQ
jgi:hypothetical protein